MERYLFNARKRGRLSHALLFLGADSAILKCQALSLAAVLLCDRETASEAIVECGVCRNCVRVKNNTHPNVKLVSAEKDLGVDQIRELTKEQHMAAFEMGPQVFVIIDSHRMTKQAANALLKTLEEPNSNRYIVMLAPNKLSVLPTILSRCQYILFPPEMTGECDENEDLRAYIDDINVANLSGRIKIVSESKKDKEELLNEFTALQKIVAQDMRLAFLSPLEGEGLRVRGRAQSGDERICKGVALEALQQACTSLRANMNHQLVLEDLLLKQWPIHHRK